MKQIKQVHDQEVAEQAALAAAQAAAAQQQQQQDPFLQGKKQVTSPQISRLSKKVEPKQQQTPQQQADKSKKLTSPQLAQTGASGQEGSSSSSSIDLKGILGTNASEEANAEDEKIQSVVDFVKVLQTLFTRVQYTTQQPVSDKTNNQNNQNSPPGSPTSQRVLPITTLALDYQFDNSTFSSQNTRNLTPLTFSLPRPAALIQRFQLCIAGLRQRRSTFLVAQALHETACVRLVTVSAFRQLQGTPGIPLLGNKDEEDRISLLLKTARDRAKKAQVRKRKENAINQSRNDSSPKLQNKTKGNQQNSDKVIESKDIDKSGDEQEDTEIQQLFPDLSSQAETEILLMLQALDAEDQFVEKSKKEAFRELNECIDALFLYPQFVTNGGWKQILGWWGGIGTKRGKDNSSSTLGHKQGQGIGKNINGYIEPNPIPTPPDLLPLYSDNADALVQSGNVIVANLALPPLSHSLLALQAMHKMVKYCLSDNFDKQSEAGLAASAVVSTILARSPHLPAPYEPAEYRSVRITSIISPLTSSPFQTASPQDSDPNDLENADPFVNAYVSEPIALAQALEFFAVKLRFAGHCLQSLPLLALFRHIAADILASPLYVFQANLLSALACLECGYVTEAYTYLVGLFKLGVSGMQIPKWLEHLDNSLKVAIVQKDIFTQPQQQQLSQLTDGNQQQQGM
ncbi:MAG: hypothetical protein EZS28_038600, partial [Streblomastix strix]